MHPIRRRRKTLQATADPLRAVHFRARPNPAERRGGSQGTSPAFRAGEPRLRFHDPGAGREAGETRSEPGWADVRLKLRIHTRIQVLSLQIASISCVLQG